MGTASVTDLQVSEQLYDVVQDRFYANTQEDMTISLKKNSPIQEISNYILKY